MWNLFKKNDKALSKPKSGPGHPWGFDVPLLNLTPDAAWTIGMAYEGCQIWGGTGSGKSTGSLAAICLALLVAGFGGLFLTSKPGDRETYERYCRETGRIDDLIIVGAEQGLCYNPLDAELRRRDAGAGITENIVSLLSTLLEVFERNSGQSGRQDEGYWRRAVRQLMRNAVDLLVMAKDRLSVPDLYRIVISAPTSREDLKSPEWQRGSFCYECLAEADAKAKTARQKADFEMVTQFFCWDFCQLSSKTRSVVVSTFTSLTDVMARGLVRELVSGPVSHVWPEMTQDGKIIVIDLPPKVFGDLGIVVQVLWKFCFQRAQERRNIAENPRPCFLVVDESHLLAVEHDQPFQTTARSSRTAVVNATQSISNYLAVFGPGSEARVHSLLGNLQTQIFHQQACTQTNDHAAGLIGRSRQFMINASNSYQPTDWLTARMTNARPQVSAGVSEVFEYEVQPSTFAALRKGGAPHWQVDAIVYQGGRVFPETGRPWAPVTFDQFI